MRSYVSIGLLAAAGLLFVLQLLPIPGIYLMMFGGAFWTGLLLTLGLLAMAVEALLRTIPRFLILIPLAAFGLYYGAFIWQRVEVASVESRLQSENPANAFTFDPAVHDLVTSGAGGFVREARIVAAFERNGNFQPEGMLRTTALAPSDCARVRETIDRLPFDRASMSYATRRGKGDPKACFIAMPAIAGRQVVEVVSDEGERWKRLPRIRVLDHRLLVDGSEKAVYRSAYAWLLSPMPIIYIGCGLVSSAPAWKCGASPKLGIYNLKTAPEGIDRQRFPAPKNILLNIPVREEDDALYGDADAIVAELQDGERRLTESVFDALFTRMDEARYEPIRESAKIMDRFPERIAGHGAALAQALVNLSKDPDFGTARNGASARYGLLARALLMLPQEEFRAEAPLVASTFGPYGYSVIPVRAAFPGVAYADRYAATFRRIRKERGGARLEPTVIALCRIGQPPEDVTAAVRELFVKGVPAEPYARETFFLFLLRVGERAVAEAGLPPMGAPERQWYERVLAGEAESPLGPNNCLPSSKVIDRDLLWEVAAPDMKPIID